MLVCDATYFGKRSDRTQSDGLLVFKDAMSGQILWYKFLKNETNADYQEGLTYLEKKGFKVLGVVTDGRRGLSKVFQNYPYQICQFHIQKGVRTLLTKNPRSEAGKELYKINKTFIQDRLTQQQFLHKIETYLQTYQDYLNEKSETNPEQYKHQRLRKALNKYKYKNNLKYMFTFQTTNTINDLPNTTNHLDGGLFSPLKNLLRNHNGLSKEHRQYLITHYLNHRNKSK
jgi:hypothetical protein